MQFMQKTEIFCNGGRILRYFGSINWSFIMKVSAFIVTAILITAQLLVASPGHGQSKEKSK